jgi:hypothetical protein
MGWFGKTITSWGGGIAVGLMVAFIGSLFVDWTHTLHERWALVDTLIADVEAMQAENRERLRDWPELMNRLATINALEKEGGRPWLMPEAFQTARFVAFETNGGKLGLLDKSLAQQVMAFYAISDRLRTEVRLLAGPSTIAAHPNDIKWLIERNKETEARWEGAASALLNELQKTKDTKWYDYICDTKSRFCPF